ncbi:hypothetical protein M8C21_028318 [Ambrosia artemisiifolia]|uniref:Uncharacterized protein n=1 Tax=Ambrosia artemisiifolia TaxID=4212 RepID=A0AAD5GXC9_AMBAR|nr:hypothetical protein M8C21_028318 [Ambrosia artemisiifolia]
MRRYYNNRAHLTINPTTHYDNADNLRRQTIHHVLQLLTTRQAARSLLAVSEHFHRLRSLSSLWVTRPRQD